MALLCHVSKGTDAYNVYKWLKDNVKYVPITKLNPNKPVYGWKIFVNGNYLGIYPTDDKSERCFTKKGQPVPIPKWVLGFKTARSIGKIDEDVSISTHTSDRKEICIFTDEGRFCRPLFIVDEETGDIRIKKKDIGHLSLDLNSLTVTDEDKIDSALKWEDLITGGLRVIEYLDTAEVESTRIAFNVSDVYENVDLRRNVREGRQLTTYTHCELHPSMMLGIAAANIPFPDHNQSPRNT